jgi:hypothetical protein
MYSSLGRGKVPFAMSFNYAKLFLVDPSSADIIVALQLQTPAPHQVPAAPPGGKRPSHSKRGPMQWLSDVKALHPWHWWFALFRRHWVLGRSALLV